MKDCTKPTAPVTLPCRPPLHFCSQPDTIPRWGSCQEGPSFPKLLGIDFTDETTEVIRVLIKSLFSKHPKLLLPFFRYPSYLGAKQFPKHARNYVPPVQNLVMPSFCLLDNSKSLFLVIKVLQVTPQPKLPKCHLLLRRSSRIMQVSPKMIPRSKSYTV